MANAAHVLLFSLLTGLMGAAGLQAPQSYQISVNVDLVVLNATVRDRKGRLSPDLTEDDFQVYENNVAQTIRLFRNEDIPVTVGLVVDHSGSMREKISDVIAAARTFVRASSPEDQMFVVNFNENVTLGLPDALPFSNRPDEMASAIANAPVSGMTALYDALFIARQRLQSGKHDKKVLIVISDGGDNASKHTLPEILKLADRSSILVYTIGIFDESDRDRNPEVLRRLALATGGEAFFPQEFKDVVEICDRIARDIRHQYTLGYISSTAAPAGEYRSIRVVARAAGKNLLVRTRSGYTAAGAK
jgi:Ca-activated chloride channel homolog